MKILIAEDDPTSLLALQLLLEGQGHVVKPTSDGEEAWQALQKENFDLAILDWMMPRMDGLKLCRKIRAEITSQFMSVMMLTAKQERTDKTEALHAGVDVFLTKPMNKDELVARIQVAERILAMERKRTVH